jgi:hypothetical protein
MSPLIVPLLYPDCACPLARLLSPRLDPSGVRHPAPSIVTGTRSAVGRHRWSDSSSCGYRCLCIGERPEDGGSGLSDVAETLGEKLRITAKRNILLEGVFGGYRLCGSVRDDLAIIDPTSEFVETYAKAPEAALHGWQVRPRVIQRPSVWRVS